jgi:hypothetical protein
VPKAQRQLPRHHVLAWLLLHKGVCRAVCGRCCTAGAADLLAAAQHIDEGVAQGVFCDAQPLRQRPGYLIELLRERALNSSRRRSVRRSLARWARRRAASAVRAPP